MTITMEGTCPDKFNQESLFMQYRGRNYVAPTKITVSPTLS